MTQKTWSTGTGTLSAGVLRATYGNGNEDGMSALLAGRAVILGPGIQGPNKFSKCYKVYEKCLADAEFIWTAEICACYAAAVAAGAECAAKCARYTVPWAIAVCLLLCVAWVGAGIIACKAAADLVRATRKSKCEEDLKKCKTGVDGVARG